MTASREPPPTHLLKIGILSPTAMQIPPSTIKYAMVLKKSFPSPPRYIDVRRTTASAAKYGSFTPLIFISDNFPIL